MSMHETVLAKLEFPVMLERLARHCRFGVAAELARTLGPSGDVATVKYLLDVTSEAVDLLTNFPEITIGGAKDVRPLTAKAAKGGRLQPSDLLLVLDMVSSARVLRRSFLRLPEVDTRFPELVRFIDHLAELPDIETDINRSIGPRGDVLDTASFSLAEIRREVRTAQARLMERLNSLVSGSRYGSALQDAI
ncbi:MAG: endonuclease MutS2, partial [Chloroflexota bacterium]